MKLLRYFIVLAAVLSGAGCTTRMLLSCNSWTAPEPGLHCTDLPKASYQACSQKKQGEAASYTVAPNFIHHHKETIAGTCQPDYKGRLGVKPPTAPGADS